MSCGEGNTLRRREVAVMLLCFLAIARINNEEGDVLSAWCTVVLWSDFIDNRTFHSCCCHGFSLQKCFFAPEVLPSGAGRPVRRPPLQLR